MGHRINKRGYHTEGHLAMDVDYVIAEVIGESTVDIGAVEVNDVSTTQKPRKTRSRKC
ncbi:hypothetical protein DPMN_041544 [Dreissena polymorpha]|uniref:Uncharacterized protein n=1 Tax=Dreissena polymorpha TaxID=45954 RepID=A0A9D4HWA8_DREPO|nr:hypothetical protein DPMN_041544 [Dreissena polymorpha]